MVPKALVLGPASSIQNPVSRIQYPVSARKRHGFTLLEVLVALVVAMALVGVSARALIAILRSEEHSRQSHAASLAIQTVACRTFLGQTTSNILSAIGEDWEATDALVEPSGPSSHAWLIWTLSPKERPSLAVEVFFLQRDEGEL